MKKKNNSKNYVLLHSKPQIYTSITFKYATLATPQICPCANNLLASVSYQFSIHFYTQCPIHVNSSWSKLSTLDLEEAPMIILYY